MSTDPARQFKLADVFLLLGGIGAVLGLGLTIPTVAKLANAQPGIGSRIEHRDGTAEAVVVRVFVLEHGEVVSQARARSLHLALVFQLLILAAITTYGLGWRRRRSRTVPAEPATVAAAHDVEVAPGLAGLQLGRSLAGWVCAGILVGLGVLALVLAVGHFAPAARDQ